MYADIFAPSGVNCSKKQTVLQKQGMKLFASGIKSMIINDQIMGDLLVQAFGFLRSPLYHSLFFGMFYIYFMKLFSFNSHCNCCNLTYEVVA